MSDVLPAEAPTPPDFRARDIFHALADLRHDVDNCNRRLGALQTELHQQVQALVVKTDRVTELLDTLKVLYQPRATL